MNLKFILNWINQSFPKHIIAKHLAQNYLYGRKDEDALYPEVKRKYLELKKIMEARGRPIWLVQSFRSVSEQNSLSSSVTKAGGLQSYHQYGLAFDVAFVGKNWNVPFDWWRELGKEGKNLGLIWGGDWDFKDYGHFEWHGVNEEFNWRKLKPYFENLIR